MSLKNLKQQKNSSKSIRSGSQPLAPIVTGYAISGVDDTALDPAGGQTVLINGIGFKPGATISLAGTNVSVVTYVNSGQLSFTSPALSAGTYVIYVTNTDGGTGIYAPGIVSSIFPTWTTATGSLGSYYETQTINNSVAATSDSSVTYSLASGTLPTGATISSSGVISGTAPADTGSTTYSFTVRATDAQLQDSTRSFSLTINTDVVTWVTPSSGATINLDGSSYTQALSATDAANYSVSYTANSLPTGLTLSSGTISGTPVVEGTTSTLLTATASTTNRSQTNTVTWVVSLGDSNWKYVSMLLTGSTPTNTFINDASLNNNQLTIAGDTKPNNFNPYSQGYYSNYFDGTGDYLTLPVSTSLAFPGDYTIECWVYLNSVTGLQGVYSSIDNAGDTWQGVYLGFSGTSFLATSYISATDTITHQTTVSMGRWYHIAIARNGSTTKSYLNGVQSSGTTTSTYSLTQSGSTIGSAYPGTSPLNGYIANLRIVKGTALYTANFTPPTSPLTAISGTQLLTCQSNRLIDNSVNNIVITKNGDVSISPAIPFTQPTSVTVNTGTSVYFDGATSTQLILPSNAVFSFGTGAYTMEGWIYILAAPASVSTIFDAGNATNAISLGVAANGAIQIGKYGVGTALISTAGDVPTGQWVHIAAVRASTAANDTKLYANGVLKATGTDANNWTVINVPTVGGINLSGFTTNGYISNVRIVKGTAVYTSAFTPSTTPLTAVAGTSLLTCQGSQIVDASTNNFAVTLGGTPKVVNTTYPFTMTTSNTTVTSLGSAYFDGGGDYLSIPTTSAFGFGTADFTCEAWIYVITAAADRSIFDFRTSGPNENGAFFVDTTNGKLAYWNGTKYGSSGTTVTLNSWNHVAFSRQSGTTRVFLNGVLDFSTSTAFDFGTSRMSGVGGAAYSTNLGGSPMYGYINDARIIKGTALYTSNFLPTYQPLTAVANTQLLTLQYNGGANNNGFVDQSSFNNIITRSGNTTQGTFSPYSLTSWSNYFGSSIYLTAPANALYAMAGDFTIECWVNLQSFSPTPAVAGQYSDGSQGTGQWLILITALGKVQFYYNGAIAHTSSSSTVVISLNTWNHLAIVRSGTTITIYVNGAVASSFTSSITIGNSTNTLYIGAYEYTTTGHPFVGNMSNFRIVNGTAVYTSAFTPSTTPLNAITNTTILTCNQNRFIDTSAINATLTVVGAAQVQPYSPFRAVTSTPSSYSVYFDGAGDYLTTPSTGQFAAAGDYTVEAWIYFVAQNSPCLINNYNSNTAEEWDIEFAASGAGHVVKVYLNTLSSPRITGAIVIPLNVWAHVALVRSGSTNTVYVNGVADGTYSYSGSLGNATKAYRIGQYSSSQYLNGYISNLRLVNGTAIYTGNFTVPTSPLTAVANTNLLTCQSNTMIDNGSNKFTLTASGDVKPKPFNPFGTTNTTGVSYSPSVNGGSMYFDSTGDYLTIASSDAFNVSTTNYTIEYWVYFNVSPTAGLQGHVASFNSASGGSFYVGTLNSTLNVRTGNDATVVSGSTSLTAGRWYHVAVVRDGTNSMKTYLNGILEMSSTTFTWTGSTQSCWIGYYSGGSSALNGYLTDIKITKGTALYTSNFYPGATPLTPTTTIGATTYSSTLLLSGTSGGIVDYHGTNDLETVGNTQLASEDPYSGSYYSNYFDGNLNSYLSIPTSSGAMDAPGDFTIELWFYVVVGPTDSNTYGNIYGNNGASGTHMLGLLNASFNASAPYYIHMLISGDGAKIMSNSAIEFGKWYHLAHTRTSGVNRMFVNGVLQTQTYTESISRTFGSTPTYIAKNLGGYVSNFRYVKGTSLYTASFTPSTTPLTAIANTTLLTCQSNQFKDNSTNNLSLTRSGTNSIKSMNPFQQNTGKSLYFDGNGDYLNIPAGNLSLSLGTSDFTIECWLYVTTASATCAIIDNRNPDTANISFDISLAAGVIRFTTSGNAFITGSSVVANQWNHVALTRNGNAFMLFLNGNQTGSTYTGSSTQNFTNTNFRIGSGANGALSGHVKDLRVTKGIARYTTTFTPSTIPLPIK